MGLRHGLLGTLVLVLGAAAAAAPAEAPVTPDDVTGPVRLGDLEVKRLDHLYLGGQPDRTSLEAASRAGVVAVVNLRAPSEQEGLGFDEARVVEDLGMAYHQVPVTGPDFFDEASVAAIEAAVASHGDQPVLVHCASGGRVGGWVAIHVGREHGVDTEQAIAVGERAGLPKGRLVESVRANLGD